ncbi:MAG: glycosyltransferase, partial [Nanoarchaeota archaeon]
SGCSLKAFTKKSVSGLVLLGETHRFIPAILQLKGYKIGEVRVNHHPRIKGKTKYNHKRLFNGMFDLINITFWHKYSTKPLYFFGKMGFYCIMLATMIILYHAYLLLRSIPVHVGPLLLGAVMLIIIGIQFFSLGLLGEIQIKNYYKDNDSYIVDEVIE